MSAIANYVPIDRRHALAGGAPLLECAHGAVLFADVAGFTPLAERLAQIHGPQRGAEELLVTLNYVYEALTAEVDRYQGSVINIAGDALTIWFAAPAEGRLAQSALRGAACALAMQRVMAALDRRPELALDQPSAALALKTTVVAGPVRRFLVGDPAFQVVEVLAGATLAELAAAAEQTRAGEVVLAPRAAALLAGLVRGPQLRPASRAGAPCLLIGGLAAEVPPQPWPALPAQALSDATLRPWLLPPVYRRLCADSGEFLTELRHTVALFLRFADLDYDCDPAASRRLDIFVRWVQQLLARHEGWLMQVCLGDKGSYLYATFGAPVAHGDDAARALAAALELRQPPPALADMAPIQIGLAGGRIRAGAVGGSTRTYSVMGDSVNLAARLMMAAEPSQVLCSAHLAAALGQQVLCDPLPPLRLKGKAGSAEVVAVCGLRVLPPDSFGGPHLAPPLIGRARELALLEQQLAHAGGGQGRVVMITGEAGVGKSRVAAQLARQAARLGWTVLRGAAQATSGQTAYFAWRPIWRALFGMGAGTPPEQQAAALEQELQAFGLPPQRLPLLAPLLGLALPDSDLTRGLEARQRKELLEHLLLECLRARLAPAQGRRAAPLLLLLEDAHWLDTLSLELLGALAGEVAGLPMLLALTWRSSDSAPQPLLERLPHASEVPLGQLTAEEASLLIAHRVALRYGPRQSVAPLFAEAIVARAEGNPFYLEELLNYVADHGIAPDDLGALQRLELPGSLTGLILSRIDRLTTEQQTLLKVASVIGRLFPLAWLWGVYPQLGPEPRVRDDLARTCALDLTLLHTPDPALTYLFKHALIQEVPYESLPFRLRAELHGRLAAWLEERQEGHDWLDLLAYHYGRSANQAKQREYLRKAAQAAAARYANAVALQYYRRLLELLGPELQAEVYLAMGQIQQSTGAWEAAETCYRQIFTLVEREGAPGLWAQAQLGIGDTLWRSGRSALAMSWLEQARELFERIGDLAQSSEVRLRSVAAAWVNGELEQAEEIIHICLQMPETRAEPRRLAYAYHMSGNIAYSKLDYPAARDRWEQSLAVKRQLGDALSEARTRTNLALAAYCMGQFAEARALALACVETFTRVGARWDAVQARVQLGFALVARGEAAAARQIQAENLLQASQLNFPHATDLCLIGLAQALQAADTGGEAQRQAVVLIAAAQPILQVASHGIYPQISAAVIEHARQRLPPGVFELAWSEGLRVNLTDLAQWARELLAV